MTDPDLVALLLEQVDAVERMTGSRPTSVGCATEDAKAVAESLGFEATLESLAAE
jgi:hypothetical protein